MGKFTAHATFSCIARCLHSIPQMPVESPFVTTKNDPLQVSKMAPRGSVASAESCCPQTGALPTWDSAVL